MKNNQILAILNAKIKKGGGGGEPVDAYTKTQTDNLLLNKVDKEDGKGLFSGSYNDLSDTPTIPTKTSQLDNDTNFATNECVDEINSNLEAHTGNKQNPHGVTKSQIGLGNVENKSSATIRSELTSSNVTTALGYTPLNSAKKGSANGVAELGSDGKVLSSQLPSYVDDVLEYSSKSSFPSKGEAGKIYVDISTNLTYRWSGSAYVEISQSLALGETSSTAYRGDRGKIAYEHSQKTSGNPHGVTKSDVGLGNVENTADNDKVVKSLIDSSGATVVGGKTGTLTYYSTEGAVSTTKDIACLEESPSSGGYSLHRMPLSKLKSRLGVDKVDNTADLDKPISTATQTALDEINSNLGDYNILHPIYFNSFNSSSLSFPYTNRCIVIFAYQQGDDGANGYKGCIFFIRNDYNFTYSVIDKIGESQLELNSCVFEGGNAILTFNKTYVRGFYLKF